MGFAEDCIVTGGRFEIAGQLSERDVVSSEVRAATTFIGHCTSQSQLPLIVDWMFVTEFVGQSACTILEHKNSLGFIHTGTLHLNVNYAPNFNMQAVFMYTPLLQVSFRTEKRSNISSTGAIGPDLMLLLQEVFQSVRQYC